MNKDHYILRTLVWVTFSASSLFANVVVDFNASSIQKPVYVGRVQPFSDYVPTLSAGRSEGYSGVPVYTAFQTDSKSLLAAGPYDDSGLKIRWNVNEGSPGDTASGLYLFKRADFEKAHKQAPVSMSADHDLVVFRFGYMNPGRVGADLPIAEAAFRLVIKDNSGFHISGHTPIKSGREFSIQAMQQTYSSYDPYKNGGNEVGTVGEESKPTFQKIDYLGFRLCAVRGDQISGGSNVGVVKFLVHAK